jgi:hypothetical protein
VLARLALNRVAAKRFWLGRAAVRSRAPAIVLADSRWKRGSAFNLLTVASTRRILRLSLIGSRTTAIERSLLVNESHDVRSAWGIAPPRRGFLAAPLDGAAAQAQNRLAGVRLCGGSSERSAYAT